MTRLESFNSYSTHPWLRKAYKKLVLSEQDIALSFIKDFDHLSKGEFEIAINRMFLDKPNKPKNYTVILELLLCANSSSG